MGRLLAVNLFVYGTLQNNDVVKALTGKRFIKIPAVLKDYKVVCLKYKPYPGLIKSKGSTAHGCILKNLDAESFNIIKNWENPNYYIESSKIECANQVYKVKFFVWNGDDVIDEPWDYNSFINKHLKTYIANNVTKHTKNSKQ